MIPYFSRQLVAERLLSVVSADGALTQMRRWLTPVFVDNGFPGPADDAELVRRLMFLFEDQSLTETEHRENAVIVVAALQSRLSNERVLQLLPLLTGRRPLCTVVARHHDGKISRTGFLSYIAKSRMPQELKHWLKAALPSQLHELCDALLAQDIERVERTLIARNGGKAS